MKSRLAVIGDIRTMNEACPRAGLMTVTNGVLSYVGPYDAAIAFDAEQQLPVPGVVYPGFLDTHVHTIPSGAFLDGADVSACRCLHDVLGTMRSYADTIPAGSPVFGVRFQDKNVSEKRFPTARELDLVSAGHPVLLFHNDLHPIALNSFALELLQVRPDLPGVVLEGGKPNGWIVDPACEDVSERLFSSFSEDFILRSYRNVEALAVRGGITTIFAKDYDYVLRPLLAHQKELRTTIKPMLRCPMNRLDAGWLYRTLEEPWAKESRPTVCIFTDGAFDGWSAAVLEPYEGLPNNYGCLFHTDEAMVQFLKLAHCAGYQLSAHAIGDAGIEQYLRTLERLLREFPRADHRHRVEHFEMPAKDQIARLSALGGAAGMQPLLLEVCEGMDMSGYLPYIGPRVVRCNPIAETIRKGVLVGGGSDFMVTDMDPLRAIACAMEHPVPDQRITVREGLGMFTAEAARIGFLEHRKGMLRAGMDADFVVLERDPAQTSGAADIRAIRINSTWAMGNPVFDRTSEDNL